MDIKGYKCPNCGGIVGFDIGAQRMKCSSCETLFERGAFEERRADAGADGGEDELFDVSVPSAAGEGALFDMSAPAADEDEGSFECAAVGAVWENLEDDDLTAGSCPDCGAELYGGKTALAMVCPCCGNAQIVEKRLSGILKPDCIIPFKRDKQAAMGWFMDFCEGNKRLLPDNFIDQRRVEDSFHGVYAPYWLFDARAEGKISYDATQVEGTGKNSHTIHYNVKRAGSISFEKIPVDSSEKMDDGYMDAIEPFNFKELEEFHPSYLAGYAAEKYDVGVEACTHRAERRMIETMEDMFMASVKGYDSVSVEHSNIKVENGRVSYGLLPVWTLNAKHDGKNYLFMMNGQTGIFVGKLPVDEGKARKYQALFTGIFYAASASFLILCFLANAKVFKMLSLGATLPEALRLVGTLASANINIFLLVLVPVFVIISAALGAWLVNNWRLRMDTVVRESGAYDFVARGGINYTRMSDTRVR